MLTVKLHRCSSYVFQSYLYQYSNEGHVCRYKNDLKSNKTMFVGVNGLFSLVNIDLIKTEYNNLLSDHTYRNHVPKLT